MNSQRQDAAISATHSGPSNHQRPRLLLLLLALCVVQLCFAGYAIVLKAFAEKAHVNAVFFSMCRDVFCFPVLLLAAYFAEGSVRMLSLHDIPLFFLLGATGMFGNQLLFIEGLYFTSPSVASIFQPVIPVFTALLAYLTCFERMECSRAGMLKQSGIVSATGGAVTMVLAKGVSGDSKNFLLGNFFLVGNTLCMAVYMLAQKKYIFTTGHRWSSWAQTPIAVTAWTYGFGALCMGMASLYYVAHDPAVFSLPTEIWLPLVYSILLSSALAYGLITWTNKHLSPTVVTAFWPVQVPATVFMSWIFFGTTVNMLQVVGAVLIIAGLLLVTYSNHISSSRGGQDRSVSAYGEEVAPMLHSGSTYAGDTTSAR